MEPLSYPEALAALSQQLGADALAHSVATAETAAELAIRYGVDARHARLAGLLHDWAREDGKEALLDQARSQGLVLTDVDRAVPYLLHARVGAVAVRTRFPGIAEEIIGAIDRHTVGGAQMTPLDKVVYIADITEPGRTYPGVEDLRASADSMTLDELFAEAYTASMKHLISERKQIHPATIEAWNALVAGSHR